MSKLGYGYGSEFHLLRFLGRHRIQLNNEIRSALARDGVLDIEAIEWSDFPFHRLANFGDAEWKGMDFLPDAGGQDWKDYWPDPRAGVTNRDGVPSWDAIGQLRRRQHPTEWLLVEAKAHETEFTKGPSCQAGAPSMGRIAAAFQKTRVSMGLSEDVWEDVKHAWLIAYYQVANRMACLNFLLNHAQVPGRLLFIYFVADRFPWSPDVRCPVNSEEWEKLIDLCHGQMGIPPQHGLSERIHHVFIDVRLGIQPDPPIRKERQEDTAGLIDGE